MKGFYMYAGIDPGKSGAVAIIDKSGNLVDVFDMPSLEIGNRVFVDGAVLSSYISKCDLICIELVSSRPGQGVASTFSFGQSFGGIVTLCSSFVERVDLATPQAWQRHFDLKKKKGEKGISKDDIAAKCLEYYPDSPIYGPRGGLKDGRSDAILIAR